MTELGPLSNERIRDITALHQRVALEGEDRYHRGEPWPDVVSRQHTAIYELLTELQRLTKASRRGRHAA